MKNYYYPRTHQMVTTAVLDMFNDMVIYRYNQSTGAIINTINIPVTFSNTEKTYQFRKEQEAGGGSQYQYHMTLPRIAVGFNGTSQNVFRSKSINTERFWLEGKESEQFDYTPFTDYEPVPIDFVYTVYILTNMMEDYSQIVENILPYFSPDCTSLRVKEFSFLNIERNLKASMSAIAVDMQINLDDQSMRDIKAEFTLTVEGYIYRPISADSSLIETINVNYWVPGAKEWFNQSNIIGYNTSAEIPDKHTYSSSGVNDDGGYYTIKNYNKLI